MADAMAKALKVSETIGAAAIILNVKAYPSSAQEVEPAEPEVTPLTLREPCPCCGGLMRIIEIFRRGQKPMSRAPPREQAA